MPPPRKNSKVTPTPVPATPAPTVAPTPTPAVERSELKGSGKTKAPPTPSAQAAPREISYDDIAKRAFEIYASRGYAPGDPAADWHEAERQLRAGL